MKDRHTIRYTIMLPCGKTQEASVYIVKFIYTEKKVASRHDRAQQALDKIDDMRSGT